MRQRLLVTGLALVLAACGSGGADAPDATSPASGTEIQISGIAFKPGTLGVAPGSEVTWTNHDATRHTVTAGTPEMTEPAFDESLDEEGDAFAFTFEEAGVFPFFCRVHPNGMRGEIAVG